MGVCASDRREPGGSSASIPGTAFFRDEIRMMIRRENDGKPSREKGQGHGGSSRSLSHEGFAPLCRPPHSMTGGVARGRRLSSEMSLGVLAMHVKEWLHKTQGRWNTQHEAVRNMSGEPTVA